MRRFFASPWDRIALALVVAVALAVPFCVGVITGRHQARNDARALLEQAERRSEAHYLSRGLVRVR